MSFTTPAGRPDPASSYRFRSLTRKAMAFLAALAVQALPAAAMAAPSESAPPTAPLEQVQALVQPAVVYEQITWTGYVFDETNDGYFTTDPFTASFQCTGFVVNPDGYVATAGHCVDLDQTVTDAILSQVVDWAYDNEYYEATPSKQTIATFARNWRIDGASTEGKPDLDVSVAYGVSVSGEPSGKALPARVVAVRPSDQGDVAVLKVEARDLTVVPLSDNASTGVGTEVVAIGYPSSVDLVTDVDFNPSFKEGTISAEKTTDSGLLPVFEISAAVSGGMSGGPTVGLTGDVIGVNSFRIAGETQAFNFVQPSQNLQEVLRGEGVENVLGTVTEQYRAGLTAYFAGNRDAAVSDFEEVLRAVPSHQFAQEYLRKAQDLPSSSSSPLLWIGLVLAALVVIGLLIALALRARRKQPGAATEAAMPVTETSSTLAPSPTQVEPDLPHVQDATNQATSPTGDAPAATEDLFCPNCGQQHESDDHFCPRCGHALR